jgi:hypothetical protein
MASISKEPKRHSGEWTESIRAMIEKLDEGTLDYNVCMEGCLTANANDKAASKIMDRASMFTKVKHLKTKKKRRPCNITRITLLPKLMLKLIIAWI